jgi:hypothetical protein
MPGLPPGYTFKPGLHAPSMLFLQKDGVTVRQAPRGTLKKGFPVWCRAGEETETIAYAQEHYKRGLRYDEEVSK